MLHEIRRISAAVNEVYIMNTDNRPIGVLDSGLGGISVLRELVKLMPGEAFLYYGDSANAPYGTRTPEEVIDLTKKDVDFLLERGAKAGSLLRSWRKHCHRCLWCGRDGCHDTAYHDPGHGAGFENKSEARSAGRDVRSSWTVRGIRDV